ncbi:MAG: transcriptional repressor, partial [Candidatus Peribacteria bacterium]|nr:transcriptional repressor [Candidatus Peribacteria bacterium]
YKATKERLDLFEFIEKKHIFSYNDLQDNFKSVSRASVFRTINLFSKLGIIRKLDL